MEKVSTAWAIRIYEGTALAGVYFFGGPCAPRHDGMRTALFSTRAEARKACKLNFAGSTAHPVKVRVSIQVIGR